MENMKRSADSEEGVNQQRDEESHSQYYQKYGGDLTRDITIAKGYPGGLFLQNSIDTTDGGKDESSIATGTNAESDDHQLRYTPRYVQETSKGDALKNGGTSQSHFVKCAKDATMEAGWSSIYGYSEYKCRWKSSFGCNPSLADGYKYLPNASAHNSVNNRQCQLTNNDSKKPEESRTRADPSLVYGYTHPSNTGQENSSRYRWPYSSQTKVLNLDQASSSRPRMQRQIIELQNHEALANGYPHPSNTWQKNSYGYGWPYSSQPKALNLDQASSSRPQMQRQIINSRIRKP